MEWTRLATSRNERRRRWFLRMGATSSWLTQWRASVRALNDKASLPLLQNSPDARLWAKFATDTRVPSGVMLEVQCRHTGVTVSLPLTDPYLLIGNHPRCGLRLDNGSGRDTEYALFWLNGELYGVDLRMNSPHHEADTHYDGWWTERQSLRLGDHLLRVRGLPGIPARVVPMDDDSTVTLQLNSPEGQQERRLTRWLTLIGCSVENDLILREQPIAPRQAALVRTPTSLWLVNLAEGQPPRITDRNVGWALLDPLDEFAFGDTKVHAVITWPDRLPGDIVPATETMSLETITLAD